MSLLSQNQDSKLIALWLALSALAITAAYFIFYPPIYAFQDEQSYLGLAYTLKQGNLLIDSLNIPVSAYADLDGRGVPIYPLGNGFLLILFTLFSWEGAFLMGIVSHLVATYFFYKLTKLWEKDNSFVTILYLLFPPFIFFSRTIMSDMPSLMFFMMAYYFYFKPGSKKWLAGIFFGINIFFRVSNVLLILPFGIALLWNAFKKKEVSSLFSFSLAVVPFGLLAGTYQAYAFGSPFLTGYSRVITGVENLSLKYWAYQIPHYLLNLSFMYPLMLPFVFLSKKIRKVEIILSMVGLTIFYSLYYFHDQFPQKVVTILFGNRFLFPVMPFFLFAYGDVLWQVLIKIPRLIRRILILGIVLSLIGACFFINVKHQRVLNHQNMLKELIYETTSDNSVVIFDQNSAELVQGVWGKRSYYAYQSDPMDILEVMEEVDKSKDVFVVRRDVLHPAAFIEGINEESLKVVRGKFDLLEIAQFERMKIYKISRK